MARLTKISATLSFPLTDGAIVSSYSVDHASRQGFFFIGLEDRTHIHKLTLSAAEALRLLHHLEEFEDHYLARRDRKRQAEARARRCGCGGLCDPGHPCPMAYNVAERRTMSKEE